MTSVEAAARICNAEVTGLRAALTEIDFFPQQNQAGQYDFRIGTAGSAMLVLQTVLPLLLNADGPSAISVEGGTHNMQAPAFGFLQQSWLPLLNRIGVHVKETLESNGFYPAGGGRVTVSITPTSRLDGFDLMESGPVRHRRLRSLIANLPVEIGEREVKRGLRPLEWPSKSGTVQIVRSNGLGNVVLAEIECDHVTAVFIGFGRVGVRAEQVADAVVRNVRTWIRHQASVCPLLADQLLLPLSLSAAQAETNGLQRGGRFRTGSLTDHSRTQINLPHQFFPVRIETTASDPAVEVNVQPRTQA